VAYEVFQRATLPFWIATTKRAFPNSDALPWDAFSALVSLVFNRGPALKGRNREEMQQVWQILSDGVQASDLPAIAKQIREMKRIWKNRGLPGLIARREAEARLVENAK
jgi:GH24 family phage-related lysozyme (muramidase)